MWLATDALGIKLVDQLGSLDDAVKKAAALAKVGEYHTVSYPAKVGWMDNLFNTDEKKGSYLDSQLHQLLGDFYEPIMGLRQDQLRNRLQARLPYDVSCR